MIPCLSSHLLDYDLVPYVDCPPPMGWRWGLSAVGQEVCLGPIWMCCLLSVKQNKEATRGHQVLTLTIRGKIWKRGQ